MAMSARLRSKKITGGELVARLLAAEGVEAAFGIPDGTYLGLQASLRGQGIRLFTPRHETSAAHMAGAYARLTGKLGVCMASNGPGVANILPGVAVEQAEGNRVLLLTSCRREGLSYPDRGGTYQYFPHVEVTRPMCKWAEAVPGIGRLAELLRKALRASFTGRPGVVHLDIPESLFNGSFDLDPAWLRPPSSYRPTEPAPAPARQVEEAAAMLLRASAPVLHAGSGVIHAAAWTELLELARLLEIPVTTSWGARGVIDERDPHAVPMIHVQMVSEVRAASDLVLVLGSRMGETDWWGKAPHWGARGEQAVIQVDLDPKSLGTTRGAELLIQADLRTFLGDLLSALRRRAPGRDLSERRRRVAEICARREALRAELDRALADRSAPMSSAHLAPTCREVLGDEMILVADGGNTAVWANFYHQVRRPNSLLGTAKMGMLGAGVAQALGAQVAHPDRPVCCILGDGAMGFHPQEVETAVRHGLPVIYLVVCDRQWGMVKITQQIALHPLKTLVLKTLGPEDTVNADLSEIAFDELGRAMGAHGERVSDPAGLRGALERAVASGRCAVIHVDVDRGKHLFAPGLKHFKAMHQEPSGQAR